MYSQTLGIHADMLSLYNEEIEARSAMEAIESNDESGAVDFRTGLTLVHFFSPFSFMYAEQQY